MNKQVCFWRDSGFTLIEIMISIALSAIILPALIFTFSFSLQAAKQGEKYTKAYTFAQEQMEGLKSLKENEAIWDWETTPVNTSSGEFYQPKIVSGSWQLGSKTTSPTESEGYINKVEITEVKRDASGNLSEEPWAIVDDFSRWVTVHIVWMENAEADEVNISSLFTKY